MLWQHERLARRDTSTLSRNRLRAVLRCSLVPLLCAAAASAGTSTATNPVVTFTTPGTKQVSLQACNPGGCNTVVRSVPVLDPMPAVSLLTASPETVDVAGVVHLAGAGTGIPPLTYGWRIVNAAGGQVAALSGPAVDWSANVPPGSYSVYLDLGNVHGTATPAPAAVTVVVPVPQMIFSDGFELGSAAAWQ
jgi:hypothetical protein